MSEFWRDHPPPQECGHTLACFSGDWAKDIKDR